MLEALLEPTTLLLLTLGAIALVTSAIILWTRIGSENGINDATIHRVILVMLVPGFALLYIEGTLSDPTNLMLFVLAFICLGGMVIIALERMGREDGINKEVLHRMLGLAVIPTIALLAIHGMLDEPVGVGLLSTIIGFLIGELAYTD